jgi:hypothetical protein
MVRRVAIALVVLGTALPAFAQTQPPPAGAAPAAASWSGDVSLSVYFPPGESAFLQPTIQADRSRLHIESRYAYEDRSGVSLFAGANFSWGKRVTLSLTPMVGALVGNVYGVVPALKTDLTWGPLSAYLESEYVVGTSVGASSFFYNWTEVGVSPASWLRAGFAGQRTRVYLEPHEFNAGVFAAVTVARIEGTVYAFNPGSSDRLIVAAVRFAF